MKVKPSVVLVMPPRHPHLREVSRGLAGLKVTVETVHSRREAAILLGQPEQPADLIISAVSLPDGNWCDLLADLGRLGSPAQMLVYASEPDERLWSEAIWRGVSDLLVEPHELGPVRKCLESVTCDPQAVTAA